MLKCFVDTDTIPLNFRAKLPDLASQTQKTDQAEQHVLQGNPALSLPTANKDPTHASSDTPRSPVEDSSNHTSTETGDAATSATISTHPITTAVNSEVRSKAKNEPIANQNLTDSSSMLKSSSKVLSEDSALVIMRTILK